MEGVRIARSSISGRGLFATKAFERGDRIREYTVGCTGVIPIRTTGTCSRSVTCGHWTAPPKSNIGRWANHSCKPNAATEVTQRKRFWLCAIKRIRPGEEIVYDYGEEYSRHRLKNCKCAACKTAGKSGNTHRRS